jgi:hypothetical protein
MKLNDPKVIVGKVNGKTENLIVTRYGTKKFPHLRMWIQSDRRYIDYTGGFTEEEFVAWM